VAGAQRINQLFVFKRHGCGDEAHFKQISRVVLKDLPIFTKVSMDFHFKRKEGLDRDQIIFCKMDQIFLLNFMT
jgi:hypothetical protein